MESHEVERLFTEKASLYHHIFIDFLRYGAGLERLLDKSGCLRTGFGPHVYRALKAAIIH